MKYLITGKNGQLAQTFIKRFEQQGADYAAPEEAQLDITSETIVEDAVTAFKPDVIINCAAYNQVDKAEQDKEKAFAVNATGPRNLARAASLHKALIVHYGSDYVFDGNKIQAAYREDDAVNPLNEYGRSKLSGEELVMRECEQHLVLRLSWVFGQGPQNFIYKLRSWASSSEYLKIACDEFSVPTWTETVVDCTIASMKQGLRGRYHLTNTGLCSRYEWAKLALGILGIRKFIRPVGMDEFALPAKRPKFSAMDNGRLSRELGIAIPAWEEAVRSFLKKNG